MQHAPTLSKKLRQFSIICFPILVTQVGLFAMNFFDTMMSGHSSAADLAGVAIGSSIWVPLYTGLSGILFALTPIVAHHLGANRKEMIPYSVIQGIYLAIAISALVFIGGMFSLTPLLDMMNLDLHVRVIAHDYLVALSYGLAPLFMYQVLRSFIDALGRTRITMFITLLALPINILLNYIFIFGKFGFPRLGGVGAGYATAITYWICCIVALVIIQYSAAFSEYKLFQKVYGVSSAIWKELLKIGIPIGFAIFFETSIFAAVTLLMSNFDTVTIAAHQSAINFASLVYMIPLSISMALTIAVGFEAGANRLLDAKQYSLIGLCVAVLLAVITSIILYVYRPEIASIYTTDEQVKRLAEHFLLYAIFFQFSDAVAAPIQGALRGYKDVKSTFVMALVSYWIIGLPLGYYLANETKAQAFGYWSGLITGLAAGAIFLLIRLLYVQQRFREKLEKQCS